MSRRIYLNTSESNFVQDSSNNADASWLLPDVTSMLATHYSVELIDCSIPVTKHTFVSGVNTTFVFKENAGADLTFEIAEGTYTGSDLATYLASEMSTAGTLTYAGSFSDTTKKMTIYTTLPDTFSIQAGTTCLAELGMDSSNAVESVTHSSVNVVNLLGTRYLDIVVNFNTHSVNPNGKLNVLHRVHIDEPIGGVVFFNNNFNKGLISVNSESLRYIEIRLYTEDNELYTIPPNHMCTYTLLLTPLD